MRTLVATFFLISAVLYADTLPALTDAEILTVAQYKTGALTEAKIQRVDDGRCTIKGVGPNGPVEVLFDVGATRVLRVTEAGRETYTWPGIVVVGHRGTVKFAPENTIAAFNAAIEHGADLLEMDVRETKDGHLIVMHDANIARTTTGRGEVALMTLEEIRVFDAGTKFDKKFTGEKVPTFAEALEAIKGRALPDIDFKAGDPKKLVEAVRAAGLVGKGTLYCGDWKKLKQTISLEPAFVIRPTAPKGLAGLDAVMNEFDPPIINIDWGNFSEELVRRIHLRGKLAFVNTMGKEDNEQSYARAIDAGADYIQSDNLFFCKPCLRSADFKSKHRNFAPPRRERSH